MDLLEYQAKELFHQVGIPVLPSQRIDRPQDIKGLGIPYPVVLKSQVPIGGRGKAGGIRFVENTIDAVAAAQTIFNLPISGKYPEVLLAEAKYNTDKEFYLAVVLDYGAQCPVLLGSQQGGGKTDSTPEPIQQVLLDQDFSPFYARRLALKMGLQGVLIESVSSVLEKMYRLFLQWDLDLVEINPLAIDPKGEVMALDGKVTINDRALGRHLDSALPLVKIIKETCYQEPDPWLIRSNWLELDGNIGILCNGTGLTMATADLVCQAGGSPACCLDVGWEIYLHNEEPELETMPGNPVSDRGEAHDFWLSHVFNGMGHNGTLVGRMGHCLDRIAKIKGVKVILVNILDSLVPCDEIALAIAQYLKQHVDRLAEPSKPNGSLLRSASRQPTVRAVARQPASRVAAKRSTSRSQAHLSVSRATSEQAPVRSQSRSRSRSRSKNTATIHNTVDIDRSPASQPIAAGVTDRHPQLVVRLTGKNLELARQHLEALQIPLLENLDDAVAKAINLVQ